MSVSEQLEQFIATNKEQGCGTVPIWLADLWLSEVKDLESRTVGGMIAEGLEELVEDVKEGRLPGWCVRVKDIGEEVAPMFVGRLQPLGSSRDWSNRKIYSSKNEAIYDSKLYNSRYDTFFAEVIPNGTELFCLTAEPVTE